MSWRWHWRSSSRIQLMPSSRTSSIILIQIETAKLIIINFWHHVSQPPTCRINSISATFLRVWTLTKAEKSVKIK